MGETKIEWTDVTWNPVTGCTKVSAGCKHCYAKVLHDMRHAALKRGKKMPAQYAVPFETVLLHPGRLDMPLRWRRPRRIFVNSVSDLFHEDVPFDFIDDVFETMLACHLIGRGHTFQILTKRPERMKAYFDARNPSELMPPPNVWLGVSVEDQASADLRIPLLLGCPGVVRWLSVEPLLGALVTEVEVSHCAVDWVVVGGESGKGSRPMNPEWVRLIRDQCAMSGVPFFFKQGGDWAPRYELADISEFSNLAELEMSNKFWARKIKNTEQFTFPVNRERMYRVGKKAAGRLLGGRLWDEYPEVVTTLTADCADQRG